MAVERTAVANASGAMRQAIWHAAALTLIIAYLNGFVLWSALQAAVGREMAVWLPAAAVAAIAVFSAARIRPSPRSLAAVAAGIALMAAALTLPDAAFPAKRVHVPQYVTLAFVVRLAAPTAPVLATAVLTVLLGVHEEMLQGFHPDRTFGHADLVVNALSSIAGALLAGVLLPGPAPGCRPSGGAAALLLALGAAVALFVLPLEGYRDRLMPYWASAPLAAVLFAWALLARDDAPQALPGAQPQLAALAALFLLYPLAGHVLALHFH